MNEEIRQPYPRQYLSILNETEKAGFTMASDILTCSLLRTLALSKLGGKFLELGTGSGLSTSWILDGMDNRTSLVSIDNDAVVLGIAEKYLGEDERLKLVCSDGETWVSKNSNLKFDYIFADTWHGKYLMLEEVLNMLKPGAFYIIDDMLAQPNWPEGHDKKALTLIEELEARKDLFITKQIWATGIMICVKK